jgi:uncharacterized OB-fold protein
MFEPLSMWTDGLIRGIPQVPRCENCGLWNWYPQPVCRGCQGADFTWHDIGTEGVVHTWTEVMRAIDSVDGLEPPYVVALVRCDRKPVSTLATTSRSSPFPPLWGRYSKSHQQGC